MKITRINHIGVLAADMEQVLHLYRDILELKLRHDEIYQGEARLCFLTVGDTQIELVAPIDHAGDTSKAIALRGEGIEHIAFEMEDLEEAMQELQGKGMTLANLVPKSGAEGSRVAFLTMDGTHGVMIELVEPAR